MSRTLRNRFLELLLEKERRENRRVTQKEIAYATGISQQALTGWVHNNVTKFEAGIVERLCEYFKCDLCDLLYFEQSPDESASPPD